MTKLIVCAAAVLMGSALPASAQARFQTGAFGWTPTLTLSDAGLDTNVYHEARDPKRDTVAVLTPQVEGILNTGTWRLQLSGQADFVYFRRYARERSINVRTNARLEVPLARLRPFAGIGYGDTRERQNSEIDLRARRTDRHVTVGTRLQLLSRTAVELDARMADQTYEQGEIFRGIDLAGILNRESRTGTVRMLMDLTPLTRFTVDGALTQDRFTLRPARDTDNLRVNAGFEFSPDAIVRGRATVGYHRMEARGVEAFAFKGMTAAVDVGYVLLGRTRFDVRLDRDTMYSLDAQPYYLRTAYGGEVLHNLFGPVDLIGRYTRERLDYPGIPERRLHPHLDRVSRYGGALAIRAAERFRFTLNYEFHERLSEASAEYSFERRRVYTTVTYGF